MGFLVVTATLHEAAGFYLKIATVDAKSGAAVRALRCFSAISNARKILSTRSTPGSFTCLHGMRVLSTTWVIQGHWWMIAVFNFNMSSFLMVEVRDDICYKNDQTSLSYGKRIRARHVLESGAHSLGFYLSDVIDERHNRYACRCRPSAPLPVWRSTTPPYRWTRSSSWAASWCATLSCENSNAVEISATP